MFHTDVCSRSCYIKIEILIFVKFLWFWLIFFNFGWFSLILVDFLWFWLIFFDFGWISLIFADFDRIQAKEISFNQSLNSIWCPINRNFYRNFFCKMKRDIRSTISSLFCYVMSLFLMISYQNHVSPICASEKHLFLCLVYVLGTINFDKTCYKQAYLDCV